jgi:hypothetical protein
MDYMFFNEMQKMNREDEMRSKLLIRGVKRILEEKKQESSIKRFFRKKKYIIEPKAWV